MVHNGTCNFFIVVLFRICKRKIEGRGGALVQFTLNQVNCCSLVAPVAALHEDIWA